MQYHQAKQNRTNESAKVSLPQQAPMPYVKPELLVLGRARGLVQGSPSGTNADAWGRVYIG